MSLMRSSLTCVTDPSALLVADTSTVINLNASGCAGKVIAALPNRLAVVDVVPGELASGRSHGRPDADLLNRLVAASLVEVVRLDDAATLHFEQLVVGPAALTLDDGEAATIAYVTTTVDRAIALVDERKANRICSSRYPDLRIGCTVDLFAHPRVRQELGAAALADAVFNALHIGRMRVLPQHVEWVIKLIGAERAARCTSLPNSVRDQLPPARLRVK